MKTRLFAVISLTTVLLIIIVVGCNKELVRDRLTGSLPETATARPVFNSNCTGPDYGTALVCPKWKGPGNDYIISPLNNPGAGTYFAMPQGLVIDSATGSINISKSETGARYLVGFVKEGSSDTCTKELVLSGITYVDSVYVLSENDTLAIPYYNADPSATSVCDNSSDHPAPGNNDCEFDDGDDDDNGNGQADEPPPGQKANDQHVRVRTTNGVINLRQSLEEGAFGQNPQNGDSKDVTIYYRLSDCSNKALQKITVRLFYYEKASDIPQTLTADIRSKRNDFFLSRYIYAPLAPRPPQVIITRYRD
ncbi:hypothetical protein [Pseudoflavitalea rhizosphaerae]|uniref:hypothetical protein n=1 Tax=Pseudoflavitalea rhizosphaerae TaxID=1884793 RepID=UPI000F8DDAE6|nr:hypothetical protein [Pseudoflavitalea rhizosphaerae]